MYLCTNTIYPLKFTSTGYKKINNNSISTCFAFGMCGVSLSLSPSRHLPLKGRPHGIQMRRRGATPDIRRVREIWWITRRPSLFRLPHRDPSLHWAPLHMLAGIGFLVRRTRGGENERGICQSGRSPHRFIVYADAKTKGKKTTKRWSTTQPWIPFPWTSSYIWAIKSSYLSYIFFSTSGGQVKRFCLKETKEIN